MERFRTELCFGRHPLENGFEGANERPLAG
uniref:Uncharacterized protein n=1 Tax=Anguilla anguilla TaxID=7936 RepID=A0A0E9SAB9_ANGAN